MLQKVVRATNIDAPIERVGAVLRDFNSHDRWHGVVDSSRVEGAERSDLVGCIRSFSLKDGNRIREQLHSLDDREHKCSYCIVESSVPLQRYVATPTPKPVTDVRRTFWHWELPSVRRLAGSASCTTWWRSTAARSSWWRKTAKWLPPGGASCAYASAPAV